MASDKYWKMLDTEYPDYVREVVTLANWSQNHDYPSPMTLYLDLIGYSESELGERLCADKMPNLGFLELQFLGDAIKEYSDKPHEVYEWVCRLMEEESE